MRVARAPCHDYSTVIKRHFCRGLGKLSRQRCPCKLPYRLPPIAGQLACPQCHVIIVVTRVRCSRHYRSPVAIYTHTYCMYMIICTVRIRSPVSDITLDNMCYFQWHRKGHGYRVFVRVCGRSTMIQPNGNYYYYMNCITFVFMLAIL